MHSKFVVKASAKHNLKYDYSRVEYVNSNTKVEIICSQHGSFWQRPAQHAAGQGCPSCANEKRADNFRIEVSKQKLTQEEFLHRSKEIHGDKYDYSKVIFNGIKYKVEIICPDHGIFEQMAQAHIFNRQGCPHCFRENRSTIICRSSNLSYNFDGVSFIKYANEIHGGIYDYSKMNLFHRENGKVCIICDKHGDFYIPPSSHITKKVGCPKCGKERTGKYNTLHRTMTTNEFIERANTIHKNLYDYSVTKYTGVKKKVDILCKIHGLFTQRAGDHLSGNGCQKCASIAKSQMESAWLDQHDVLQRNVRLKIENRVIVVDGFDQISNTIYEFWGNYWHGNPRIYDQNGINMRNKKTFGALYQETLNKIALIKNAGYNLVQIWEDEWLMKTH